VVLGVIPYTHYSILHTYTHTHTYPCARVHPHRAMQGAELDVIRPCRDVRTVAEFYSRYSQTVTKSDCREFWKPARIIWLMRYNGCDEIRFCLMSDVKAALHCDVSLTIDKYVPLFLSIVYCLSARLSYLHRTRHLNS